MGYVAVALALLASVVCTQQTYSQESTDFEPTWYMVVDWANLLDEGQELSAINDAWRLNQLGIPTQVVTEFSESTPELARQRAEQIRHDHGIETSPGADDGLVVYAAVNPNNRANVIVAIDAGEHALPHGGLDEEDLDEIAGEIILPQLANDRPARAIVYSMREMIYRDVFTPPQRDPRTGLQQALHEVMPWMAPIVGVVTAGLALRATGDVRSFGDAVVPVLGALLVALAIAALGIAGQSGITVFVSVGLVGISVLCAMRSDQALRARNRRQLTSSARPPGAFVNRGGRA